jgi:hypothetical protein
VSRTLHISAEHALKLHFREKCPLEVGKEECGRLKENMFTDENRNGILDRWKMEIEARINNNSFMETFLTLDIPEYKTI